MSWAYRKLFFIIIAKGFYKFRNFLIYVFFNSIMLSYSPGKFLRLECKKHFLTLSLKCSICCNDICYFRRLPVIGWMCSWVFMNHLLLPEMKHWNNESHCHLFHSKTCRHEATQFSSLIFSKCCITQQGAGRRNCNVMSTDCWCVQRDKLFVFINGKNTLMTLIIGLLFTVAHEVLKWRFFSSF